MEFDSTSMRNILIIILGSLVLLWRIFKHFPSKSRFEKNVTDLEALLEKAKFQKVREEALNLMQEIVASDYAQLEQSWIHSKLQKYEAWFKRQVDEEIEAIKKLSLKEPFDQFAYNQILLSPAWELRVFVPQKLPSENYLFSLLLSQQNPWVIDALFESLDDSEFAKEPQTVKKLVHKWLQAGEDFQKNPQFTSSFMFYLGSLASDIEGNTTDAKALVDICKPFIVQARAISEKIGPEDIKEFKAELADLEEAIRRLDA